MCVPAGQNQHLPSAGISSTKTAFVSKDLTSHGLTLGFVFNFLTHFLAIGIRRTSPCFFVASWIPQRSGLDDAVDRFRGASPLDAVRKSLFSTCSNCLPSRSRRLFEVTYESTGLRCQVEEP